MEARGKGVNTVREQEVCNLEGMWTAAREAERMEGSEERDRKETTIDN